VNLLYICIIYTELLLLPGELLRIYLQTFLVEISFSAISLFTIMDIPMSLLWYTGEYSLELILILARKYMGLFFNFHQSVRFK